MQNGSNTILVTGGAGYIGSAVSLYLLQQGYQVIVVDKKLKPDFFKNPDFNNLVYYQADFADPETLAQIFTQFTVSAVMHFAAFIEVGESMREPAKYYENNVVKTFRLLDLMREHGVDKLVFSSSCAIYGLPVYTPIDEAHQKNPVSPYGKTKLIVEQILEDYARAYNFNPADNFNLPANLNDRAYNFKYCALRYFNAAGAWPEFDLGERHEPETHVIPLLLKSALTGTNFTIFGSDYNTPDGTCIRDYLHIRDLADAHYKALKYLDSNNRPAYILRQAQDERMEKHKSSVALNLGTGTGYSVLELVTTVQKITGLPVNLTFAQRRAGDPDRLIAQAELAQKLLDWQPEYSSLENIIETAYRFYFGNPWTAYILRQAQDERMNKP